MQRSSNLINNIKNGKNLIGKAVQKRVASGGAAGVNIRKSFGAPVGIPANGSILNPSLINHQKIVDNKLIRP